VRLSQDDTEAESSADEVSLLFVQNTDGANLDGDSLTMVEVNPTIGWFSHRPAREAGPMATAAATPPCLTVAGGEVRVPINSYASRETEMNSIFAS
jgi:hypothetical protein